MWVSQSLASAQQKDPTVTGTVGLPWFHPGSPRSAGTAVRSLHCAGNAGRGAVYYLRFGARLGGGVRDACGPGVPALLPSLVAAGVSLLVLVLALSYSVVLPVYVTPRLTGIGWIASITGHPREAPRAPRVLYGRLAQLVRAQR